MQWWLQHINPFQSADMYTGRTAQMEISTSMTIQTDRMERKSTYKGITVISSADFKDRTMTFTGEGTEPCFTHSMLPVLFRGLFCKWRWGLSDKAGRDERRRANMGLSSEQIQFHSINIDVLLSPTKWFNSALRHLLQLIHTTVTYTLEGLLFGDKTEE